MEHRDQKQESHGVHVCNKCGWPFPNSHPSAKHRRAHKRVCGTIEGFKLVESEATNTILTISDDDGDQKSSSPKVLGGSCDDKVVDGMKKKSKESEDDVFSDAVADFSEGVGLAKFVGDALDSVGYSKMVAEDEMNSSQILKDREVLVLAEITINHSGSEQENKVNQEIFNLETVSGTPLSSSPTEHQKIDSLVFVETAIDQSGNEQETKVDQELVNLKTDFGTPSPSSSIKNQKVEISVVPEATINQSGIEQESKINREFVNLETNIKTGDSVVPPNDHTNTTTASDLYPIEPETIISAQKPERNIDSVENLVEIATSSGKINNYKFKPVPKMEETNEVPTEPTAHNETFLSMVDDNMSIHFETPPSVIISDTKPPTDLTQVTSNALKELESCSSNNILETGIIKEENDSVHLPSVSSDLNVVDHPEALVEDSKDHKEVQLTNCVVEDPHEGDSDLEDNFKDPIPEESYSTLQAGPFDQASEVASFDMKTVENRQKQESGGNNVSIDARGDCSQNSSQETEEIRIQEVNAGQVEGILSENEKHAKSRTVSDAAKFGIDSIPSASFSPEVESVAPSKNSLDYFSENATGEVNENSIAASTGSRKKLDDNEVGREGILLANDEDKAGACRRNLEDTVQVPLSVDAHERKDNGIGEKDIFDHPDIAGVEDKKDPSEETFLIGIDSTQESTTNSRENKCIAVAEAIVNESPRKFPGTERTDSKSFDICLVLDTQQSVKDDDPSGSIPVASISEVNSDDQSCHVRDFNAVQNSSDIPANKEANLVSVSNESVTGRLEDAPQDGSVSQLVGNAVRIPDETWKDHGVKIDVKPQLTTSFLDASVDAGSRTDSLEGNWGSVSVLSTQSDLPAFVDGEVTPAQAQAEAEETDSKKAGAATERQHSNRSDLFEPPSFMTLVEPNGGGIQNSAASEIQTAQNQQQPNSISRQAGWFPSYTHVANDSPGRKKNEAIIAKVTNWSTGKPHTALKNLLDDAALENKQKSPTQKENLASMIQKDETSTKNGSIDKTVNTVMQPKSPTSQLGNKEISNEWNSPARYPSDIRRERRKGRPYWAQFVCCSSVH